MALKPLTYEDPLYQLLRDGNIKEFNKQKPQGGKCDLASCDFRHLDLRGLDAQGIDFSNAYFRASDLRGIDFSKARLEGASINGARISRAFFIRRTRHAHALRQIGLRRAILFVITPTLRPAHNAAIILTAIYDAAITRSIQRSSIGVTDL